MGISFPLMAPVVCWLTPSTQGKGLEATCTSMRMKLGLQGAEVGPTERAGLGHAMVYLPIVEFNQYFLIA